MRTGWNYKDLSKFAEMSDDLAILINKIKEGSFQIGLVEGRKESIPWIIISVLIMGSVLAYEEVPKLMKVIKSGLDKKTLANDVIVAEEVLLTEIRQAGITEFCNKDNQ